MDAFRYSSGSAKQDWSDERRQELRDAVSEVSGRELQIVGGAEGSISASFVIDASDARMAIEVGEGLMAHVFGVWEGPSHVSPA